MKANLPSLADGLIVRVRAHDDPSRASSLARVDGDHLWSVDELYQPERLLGPRADFRLLPPVTPSKIICVGLNYQRHAEEMNKPIPEEPLLFLKPPTTLIGPGDPIELPSASHEVHHEGELALIMKERLKDATPDDARSALLGYTCACDVTARDIQRREKRYTRAKGFDTFLPLGPGFRLVNDIDIDQAHLTCMVNGELRQTSQLNDFIFPIPEVLAFISSIMTLLPGDVILTGTPHGVGPIVDGDRVEVRIDSIGTLINPVTAR